MGSRTLRPPRASARVMAEKRVHQRKRGTAMKCWPQSWMERAEE